MHLKGKGKSILQRLVMTVMLIVFIQAAVVGGTLIISNVVPNLKDNAYEIFAEKVNNRRSYIEGEMHNRWSVIDDYIPQFVSYYPRDGKGVLNNNQVKYYFQQSFDDLIAMLRDTGTTGAFIILDDNLYGKGANSCLYFTDSDPQYNDLSNNSDLMMLKGPLEFLEDYKMPLHISWNYGLTLTDDNRDIFYKPYEAAQTVKNYQHLGYWHSSQSLTDPNARMITYTKPLINEVGKAFGVVGIEISQDYFYEMFPSGELSGEGFSGYAVLEQREDGQMYPLMVQGAALRSILPYEQSVELELKNANNNGYRLKSSFDESIALNLQELKLYNKNTPFSDTKWFLTGLTEEDMITASSNRVSWSIVIALLVATLLGVCIAVAIGMWFASPIVGLVKRIKSIFPGQKVQLDKTGMIEIDALSLAIEKLADDVLDSVTKTDKIISMVDLAIGSFDYKTNSDKVQVSEGLVGMLKLPVTDLEIPTVDKQEFLSILSKIKAYNTDENIYQYSMDPPKWLKLESVETDSGSFGVAVDVTKDELTKKAIMFERDFDVLTGIYNRFAFHREFTRVFEQKLGVSAFMMGDLDNLKFLNDTYGHDLGDKYIKMAARFIAEYFADKNAVYGRMSGDEFYVFLYNYESQDEIRKIIYEFYIELNDRHIQLADSTRFKLKMSSGVSWYPYDSMESDELIRFADFAMYQGKHTVKGGVREFDKSVYNADSYMVTGKEELYSILDDQLIDYVFQPIVSMEDGTIYGYEALMRPQGMSINTPDRLINLAHSQGQLWKIEKNTLYMTLELYKKYRDLFGEAKLFINSVPNQVLKEEEYAELEYLYHDFLDHVVLEITESESMDNYPLERKKQLVKQWNALLALDDYGSGYANDIMLINLRPNIVKIDQFLIDGIEWDVDKQSIVSKTVDFAKERNILVLAEGVETREQLATLKRLGVNLLQGYYISRPIATPSFNVTEIARTIEKIW